MKNKAEFNSDIKLISFFLHFLRSPAGRFFTNPFFNRQHPETALRYLPIIDLLKKEKLASSKVLEVGSGSYGITPYLKRKIVGVDSSFDEPEFSLLVQVKGTATNLPFRDKQFEVVILSDVLEHVSKFDREKVLEEAIRVAKKMVVISGPFGVQAAKQDKKLAKYSVRKLGRMHPFFKDHLKYGLPEVLDIQKLVKNNLKVRQIKVVGQFLNLLTRERLMKIYITKNTLIYYFYLKGLMFFVPVLRLMNKKPCYRTLIKITVK